MQTAATLPAYHPRPLLAYVGDGEGSHALRLIYLIFGLIDHGKALLAAARRCSEAQDWTSLRAIIEPFGTLAVRVIVDRIYAAMARASLLQTGLQRLHGFGRWSNARASLPPLPKRASRGPRPRPTARRDRDNGPSFATITRRAARLLRHPIDEVIADLCRDLGIAPDHPLWQDLYRGLVAYGAGVAAMDRQAQQAGVATSQPDARPDAQPGALADARPACPPVAAPTTPPEPRPQRLAVASTGPPPEA